MANVCSFTATAVHNTAISFYSGKHLQHLAFTVVNIYGLTVTAVNITAVIFHSGKHIKQLVSFYSCMHLKLHCY